MTNAEYRNESENDQIINTTRQAAAKCQSISINYTVVVQLIDTTFDVVCDG